MKPQDLHEQGPKLGEIEIVAFEKQIGFILPDDYREFLLQTNGGVVPESTGYFCIESDNWWNHLNLFYGLRVPETPTIELMAVLRRLRESYTELFDLQFAKLPIASDHYGNKIYIVLNEPENGSVYFWMHDAEVEDDKLSSSFQDFLDSLREKPSKAERPELYER